MTNRRARSDRWRRSPRGMLLRDGCRDILPMSIGYFPIAFAVGGVIASASIGKLAGWAGGPLISAGSAQLALIDVLSSGGGLVAAVVAALVINSRLIAYSAGLAPWFAHENRRWKLIVGFFTIDATYMLATARFRRDDPGETSRRWYVVGMGLTLYPAWAIGMAIGVVVGGSVPDWLAVEAATTFMMVGLLALAIDTPMIRLAALAGGLVGLTAAVVPGTWTPILAAAVASVVANLSTDAGPRPIAGSDLPVAEIGRPT